jgi:exodeoxyribonuclease III
MRIATWNVNSVLVRAERLGAWLTRHQPDVLCLQELKAEEEKFPSLEVRALGYHAAIYGQRSYNGVAILSREAPSDVRRGFEDGEVDSEGEQARLISARFGDLRVISVYVPNGQELGSEAYAYKLRWLGRLKRYLERHHKPEESLVVAGDFNCAPADIDVARPAEWTTTVLAHPEVRAAVADVMTFGLVDVFREKVATPGLYSWWDYRALGFAKNNGLRIDLLLGTPTFSAGITRAWIDRDERKGKKPSDHVPVVVE